MSKPRKQVLVVDDEPDVGAMIADVLANYQVDVAHSHDDADTKLASGEYDVVVLDIMGVSGEQLLERYGERFPCIVLTAHSLDSDTFKRTLRANARLFLPKEEMSRLDEYTEQVIAVKESLWGWLLRKVDFARWFGKDWLDEDLERELAAVGQLPDTDRED